MKMLRLYLRLLSRYAQYFWRAKTIYDIHSPFVADLVNAILEDKRHFYAFSQIELLRDQLLQMRKKLNIEDHGAGSLVNKNQMRSVASIARHSAISPATGRQLFRLVNFCKPNSILELGTSLGISTLYLASGALHAKVITLEGCPDIARQAQHNFDVMNTQNITLREGIFEKLLPQALEGIKTLDFLFLDGDHRAGASLQYFEQCLPCAHARSVFVIADIHWSDEMQQAWHQMRRHPRVSLSIDLFHIGILFFRTENRQPEHFTLINKAWKPWRIGLF